MKKIYIIIGVLLSLTIAALLIVPSFIDWTGYRVEIAQKMKEATGRDLLIGGDIAFSLVPSPILRVNDIHLSNVEGAASNDMIAIRQLDVQVSFLPLLGGNVHIQSIRLIEPVIHLEMMANGQGNWSLNKEAQPSGNVETQPQAGSPVFDDEINEADKDVSLPLQIDDFIIEKGQVFYSDVGSGIIEHIENLNSRFSLAGLTGPFEAAGTLSLRGIPVGFDASVGRIVHGRTASFASQVKIAHGKSRAGLSGTFVSLAQGPKIQGKIEFNGESLAGFLSAFQVGNPLPGGLNRPFGLEGEITYAPSGLSLGKNGLSVTLGEDHGKISAKFDETPQRNLKASVEFSKIDGDAWLNAAPFVASEPEPLPLVITLSNAVQSGSGGRVSAALSRPPVVAKKEVVVEAKEPLSLPKEIEGQIALSVEALILKGEPIRQFHTSISIGKGELALERLSAVLPGAGEVSLVGVAGPREGKLQFDGSFDLSVSHLRGALDWIDIDLGNVPSDRLQKVTLHTEISANEDEIRLIDMVASVDSSKLEGAATIALRSRPSFGVNLNLDSLNVDAYKVRDNTEAPLRKSSTNTGKIEPQAKSKTKKATSTQDTMTKALQVLDGFDANLSLAVTHLVYEGRDVRNVVLDGTIYNGDVTIKEASVKNFAGVNVGASGTIKRKDSSIFTENLNVKASGKNWREAANVFGGGAALDWDKVGPVSFSTTLNGNVLAPDVDLNVDILGGSAIVAANVDVFPLMKGDATVSLQFADVNRVVKGINPSYRPSGKIGPLEFNGDVGFNLAGVSIKNIIGKIGDTDLSGKMSFKQGKRPYLDADLQVGNLRLDPFMVKDGSITKAAATVSKGASSTSQKSTQPQAKGTRWSHEKIDFSGLKALDANIKFKAESLSHHKITSQNVVLLAQLKEGMLGVSNTSATIFGGAVELISKLDVQDLAKLNIDVQATGLNVAQVLAGTGQETSAGGQLDLSARIQSQGDSEADLVSGLNGVADINLQKISVGQKSKGGSALDVLNLLAVLSGTDPKKGLADVELKSEINKGVAVLKTANLTSNIATGAAQGHVDLPQWLIDVSGTLNVKQNALIGLLANKAKMKTAYPFSVRGDIDKPNVKLDTGGVSSGGGLVIPLGDKLEQKGYGNLLRGLLGAGGVKTSTPEIAPSTPNDLPPADGAMAPPPPPPPPGGSSQNTTVDKSSKEQLILQGLGSLLNR